MKKMIGMMPKNRRPTTPGEMLLHEFLEPLNLTITDFSKHINMPRHAVSEIIHGRRSVTPLTAMRFAAALGNEAQLWITLQIMVDMYDAYHSKEAKIVASIKPYAYATTYA